MKFVKGRLYRIVKYKNPRCIGCIARYIGINTNGDHYGKTVKKASTCNNISYVCSYQFQIVRDSPDEKKLEEYINMVKFCKKLKEKLDGEKK